MSATKLLSFREFAALRGVSHQAVSKAVSAGRLSKSVSIVDGTRMIDPEIAASEWRENTRGRTITKDSASPARVQTRDHARTESSAVRTASFELPELGSAKDAKASISLARAQTQHTVMRAMLSKLDYEERTGALIKVDLVRTEIHRLTRTTRDALKMIPPRISGELASITDQREIEAVLARELDLALEALSKPEFYDGR